MFTLAWKAITSLVVSFDLNEWFDVKKGEATSSVRRTALASLPPVFGSTNSPASRWRRSRPDCGRASSDNLTGSAKGSLGEGPHGLKSAATSAIL
jgi:hypothetical protein